jgi:hypothetical protein
MRTSRKTNAGLAIITKPEETPVVVDPVKVIDPVVVEEDKKKVKKNRFDR